jgi:hypothetical protein
MNLILHCESADGVDERVQEQQVYRQQHGGEVPLPASYIVRGWGGREAYGQAYEAPFTLPGTSASIRLKEDS